MDLLMDDPEQILNKLKEDIRAQFPDNQPLHDYLAGYAFASNIQKKKRLVKILPPNERCCGKQNNWEQCLRKRADGELYCKTHLKALPFGCIDVEMSDEPKMDTVKMDVFIINVKGISYYADKFGNIYHSVDIIQNALNPRVLGRYEKNNDGYVLTFM